MEDKELRKTFLLCLGALAEGFDKACDIIDELLKKGEITIKEARELRAEMKKQDQENCHGKSRTQCKIDQTVHKVKCNTKEMTEEFIKKAGLVKKEEYDQLKKELELLKEQLDQEKSRE